MLRRLPWLCPLFSSLQKYRSCVKCGNDHPTKACTKTADQPLRCCNCAGEPDANYRKCPTYATQFTLRQKTQQLQPLPPHRLVTNSCEAPVVQHPSNDQSSYAATTKKNTLPESSKTELTALLSDAILRISTFTNIKETMMSVLTAIIVIIQNACKIKTLYWNCQDLGSRRSELLQLTNQIKIDVLLQNKTHLSPRTPFKLPNFHTFRNDRISPTGVINCGGTAILIHHKFAHNELHIQTNSIETTTITIMLNNRETRLSA